MNIAALAGNTELASIYREIYSSRIVKKSDTSYNNTVKPFDANELLKRINNNKVKEEEDKSNIVYSEEKTESEKAIGNLIDVEA